MTAGGMAVISQETLVHNDPRRQATLDSTCVVNTVLGHRLKDLPINYHENPTINIDHLVTVGITASQTVIPM